MRVVRVNEDISLENLYPVKRRYFSIFFIGYQMDLSYFCDEFEEHIPSDWPIILFTSVVCNPDSASLDHIKKCSAMSQAAVMWNVSDCDVDFSINPHLWSGQIGRIVSSNKKAYFGSPVAVAYKAVASSVGHDKWYSSLSMLCADLALYIKDQLVESVTLESKINVRSNVR